MEKAAKVKHLPRKKRRRGVTLLITLSVIAAMLALVGVLFGYVDRAREAAAFRSAIIQADLLRSDLEGILTKVLKKDPSLDDLQKLYATPFVLQPHQGDFLLNVHCSPLLNRLPISWLGKAPSEKTRRQYTLALKIFEEITEEAGLRDAPFLLELIQRSLQGSQLRFATEIRLQGGKGIISSSEFQRLLDDYRFARDDPNVYRISWRDYFAFSQAGKAGKIDAEFITPSLLARLLEVDPLIVREGFVPGKLKDFLNSIGAEEKPYAWLFSKRPIVAMRCEGSYLYREKPYAFHFDYFGQRIERFGIENE
jgi:hypothetical protein